MDLTGLFLTWLGSADLISGRFKEFPSKFTGLKSLFFRETKGDSTAPGFSPEPEDWAAVCANLFTSSVLDHLAEILKRNFGQYINPKQNNGWTIFSIQINIINHNNFNTNRQLKKSA